MFHLYVATVEQSAKACFFHLAGGRLAGCPASHQTSEGHPQKVPRTCMDALRLRLWPLGALWMYFLGFCRLFVGLSVVFFLLSRFCFSMLSSPRPPLSLSVGCFPSSVPYMSWDGIAVGSELLTLHLSRLIVVWSSQSTLARRWGGGDFWRFVLFVLATRIGRILIMMKLLFV